MELSDYSLEKLRTDGEFLLYRGRHARPTQASAPSLLVLTPVSDHPEPASLRRLDINRRFRPPIGAESRHNVSRMPSGKRVETAR